MDFFALACLVSVLLVLALGDRYLYVRTRAQAIDEGEYLPRRAHRTGLYSGLGSGRFVLPLRLAADPVDRVVAVELAGDPRYAHLELHLYDDAAQGRGAVAVTRDHAGDRAVYIDPGLRLLPGSTAWYGPTPPREAVIDHEVVLGDEGLEARFGFLDEAGRRIDVAMREGPSPRRRTSFLMSPGPRRGAPPGYFPVALGGAVGFISHRGMAVQVRVDGVLRRPRRHPIPVDGRFVYRAWSDLDPTFGRVLGASSPGVPWLDAGSGDRLRDGDQELSLTRRDGHCELDGIRLLGPGRSPLHLTFAPALPDLLELADGARARGRFALGVGEHRAVVAGEYRVSRVAGTVELTLRPVHGWQLAPGRSWVRGFRFCATLHANGEGDVSVISGWSRS